MGVPCLDGEKGEAAKDDENEEADVEDASPEHGDRVCFEVMSESERGSWRCSPPSGGSRWSRVGTYSYGARPCGERWRMVAGNPKSDLKESPDVETKIQKLKAHANLRAGRGACRVGQEKRWGRRGDNISKHIVEHQRQLEARKSR